MEFRILGPVEVWGSQGQVRLGGAKQLALLSALIMQANRVVSVERLGHALWEEDLPGTVTAALQTYVFRLRRALAAVEPAGGERIVTHQAGYRLRVDPGELDLGIFRGHVERARSAATAELYDEAAKEFQAALALWRGAAFTGVPGSFAQAQAFGLGEEHLAATEEYAEVELELGRHVELIPELTALVAAHPLRERLHGHLMLALYRSGRQAEALQAFQDARRTMVRELGIDPGAELTDLHQRILRGAPELSAAQPQEPPSVPVRRNDLPGDVADFTGRDAEVRRLLAALPSAEEAGAAVVIAAIDGMAGIGKTTLAVHAAHQLTARYPDAQLFIDLHAHTAGHDPVEPGVALETLLRALGVPGEKIPDSMEARAALWRAELAGRRALVVLDNAASAAQVRPLLPGASGCLVLVTSRRRLAALEAAHTLSMDVLPPADARALFAHVAGDERATTDPDATDEVARLCGYLPLALRIAAARLRQRPAWTTAHLAARLRENQQYLTELAVGDRSVAAAFTLSYQHLDTAQQRLFRLLGLVPGPDFDAYAAAALADRSLGEVEQLLEDLVDVHLLQQRSPGRYRFHDLLHHHARTIAQETDDEHVRYAAVTRMLDYYLHATVLAAQHFQPHRQPPTIDTAKPPAYTPQLPDFAEAVAWLDAEHANLSAVIAYAASTGRTHAWQLPHALWRFYFTRNHIHDWIATHQHALTAARQRADSHARAETLKNLGIAYWMVRRHTEALDHLQEALALHRQIGDQRGEASTLNNLGVVYRQLGRYEDALTHVEQALALQRELGDRRGEGHTLANLGNLYGRLGRPLEALANHQRALTLNRQVAYQWGEANALGNLGNVYARLGRYHDALDHLHQALDLNRQVGYERGEGRVLGLLGTVYARLNRCAEALDHQERALAINRQVGYQWGEAHTLANLGGLYGRLGRYPEALDHLDRALELNRRIGYQRGEGKALGALGIVYLRLGRCAEALEHLHLALDAARAAGDRDGQSELLNDYGEACRAAGRRHAGRLHHQHALSLAERTDNPYQQARAHDGIAATLHVCDPEAARRHWRLALAIYVDLGLTEARQVRYQLEHGG
ncbi:tetratricopeptide repeat protein [Solihabitans fulvus]|uniref:Tetratricopeptide repeat protein n=1 Tax=Solihabitans fulvus TaxID=1892852 RepID=A0A5B2WVC3_9PSEU|nr:tetratricopeptide repeat protein [Solihabitans fulvus]KAA2254426.1 tetratricopeptide repeat protein [Solihabitans fulvus]